ncbi:MAG: sugar transferase [Pseudomonadota bacterium]|nr:sugar transferase [Pseudomonadota bacterium]
MIKQEERYYSYIIILMDYLAVLVSYAVAAPCSEWLVAGLHGTTPTVFASLSFCEGLLESWLLFYYLFFPLLLFPLLAMNMSRVYRLSRISTLGGILRETAPLFIVSGVIFFVFFEFAVRYRETTVMTILLIASTWTGFIVNRLFVVLFIRKGLRQEDVMNHLLIVGTGRRAMETARTFARHPEWPVLVVGFLSERPEEVGGVKEGFPVLGSVDDLSRTLTSMVVDSVLVSETIQELTTLRRIAALCNLAGVDFTLNPSLISGKAKAPFLERYENINLLVYKFVDPAPFKLLVKRLLDLAASACLIVFLIPLWIVLPVIIYLDSPGPAFFIQERVGKNGRRFRMWKYRSMVQDADLLKSSLSHLNEMDGPVFKIKEDPRITKVGRFIRRTSIDELPQLFNVLMGSMSLVGPRPPVPSEVAQYGLWQKKRLSVKPGITCLWQISGRNEIKFDEWMRLDRQYIENWSLTLDMKILLKTVWVVLSRKGAG